MPSADSADRVDVFNGLRAKLMSANLGARNRNLGLDGMRALAILMVLFSHGRILLPEIPSAERLALGGYLGVELFFVLSGYLIGCIFIQLILDRQPRSVRAAFCLAGAFWVRRWFRTLPNYFLFLFLNVTLFSVLFADQNWSFSYLFFLQNFVRPCPALMPESWSLAVEEWFYISLPVWILAILVFASVIGRTKDVGIRGVLFGCISVYLIAFIVLKAVAVAFETEVLAWDAHYRKVVVFRLDACGWGVLVAWAHCFFSDALKKCAMSFFVIGFVLLGFSLRVLDLSGNPDTGWNKVALMPITSVSIALMLPYCRELRIRNKITVSCITHLSVTSYSLYLLHLSFVIPLLVPIGRSLGVFVVYLVLALVCATLVNRFFEVPMTTLRERFTSRERHVVF